jgi:hypothetical protein
MAQHRKKKEGFGFEKYIVKREEEKDNKNGGLLECNRMRDKNSEKKNVRRAFYCFFRFSKCRHNKGLEKELS